MWVKTKIKNIEINEKSDVRYIDNKQKIEQKIDSRGYMCLVGHNIKVHILMAETFLTKDDENHIFVDHIDRNRSNNELNNLRYVTVQENIINSNRIKTFIGISPNGEIFYSNNMSEFARRNNLNVEGISLCLSEKYNNTKGFTFYEYKLNNSMEDIVIYKKINIIFNDYKRIKYPILCYNPIDSEMFLTYIVSDIEKRYNLKSSIHIYNCLNNKTIQYNNLYFTYLYDNIPLKNNTENIIIKNLDDYINLFDNINLYECIHEDKMYIFNICSYFSKLFNFDGSRIGVSINKRNGVYKNFLFRKIKSHNYNIIEKINKNVYLVERPQTIP